MPVGKRGGGGHGGGGGGHDSAGGLRWLLTYADMITLLLALFIFLFSISSINKAKLAAFSSAFAQLFGMGTLPTSQASGGSNGVLPRPGNRKEGRPSEIPTIQQKQRPSEEVEPPPEEPVEESLLGIKDKLTHDFPDLLNTGKMTIYEEEGGIVLRMLDTALFGLGSADITSDARTVLAGIAASLRDVDNEVCVEGHTDDLPIRSARFRSNWELSAERAASVVHYFITEGGIIPQRLSLAGYGEYRPIAPNVPNQGNPQNRRVEIRVLGKKN